MRTVNLFFVSLLQMLTHKSTLYWLEMSEAMLMCWIYRSCECFILRLRTRIHSLRIIHLWEMMHQAAVAVGNWIYPIICPHIQQHYKNVNGGFATMSWEIIAEGNELDILR